MPERSVLGMPAPGMSKDLKEENLVITNNCEEDSHFRKIMLKTPQFLPISDFKQGSMKGLETKIESKVPLFLN